MQLKIGKEESVFQFPSGKLEIVCLPTGIDSVDIKSVIWGRINCIPLQQKAVWRGTRPFRPRAGDVIHPVLWLVKGRAIARLYILLP